MDEEDRGVGCRVQVAGSLFRFRVRAQMEEDDRGDEEEDCEIGTDLPDIFAESKSPDRSFGFEFVPEWKRKTAGLEQTLDIFAESKSPDRSFGFRVRTGVEEEDRGVGRVEETLDVLAESKFARSLFRFRVRTEVKEEDRGVGRVEETLDVLAESKFAGSLFRFRARARIGEEDGGGGQLRLFIRRTRRGSTGDAKGVTGRMDDLE